MPRMVNPSFWKRFKTFPERFFLMQSGLSRMRVVSLAMLWGLNEMRVGDKLESLVGEEEC